MNIAREDIDNFTGVRYVEDTNGKIIPTKLGGKYDLESKTFTFYTDQFSYYGVLKAEDLKQLKLTIGSKTTTVNGVVIHIDVAPTIYNNRTLIPLRNIVENIGGVIEWDETERKVIIELEKIGLKWP